MPAVHLVQAAQAGAAPPDAAGHRDQQLQSALAHARERLGERDFPEAAAALQRARWLRCDGSGAAYQDAIERFQADLDMAIRLEAIYAEPIRMVTFIDYPSADHLERASTYFAAFRDYGLDVAALDPATAAARVAASAIRNHLVTAMDQWCWCYIYFAPKSKTKSEGGKTA